MQHRQLGTFLRLIGAEWASLVTGSLSAILVFLGLGISIAGAAGVAVPQAAIIQVATWAFAAICGGWASYSVWVRERATREEAETRLAQQSAPHLQEARKRFVDDAVKNLTPSAVYALKIMVITGRPTDHINEFDALEKEGLIVREFAGPRGLKIRDELSVAIQDRLLRRE
jgi:hypothetical protein